MGGAVGRSEAARRLIEAVAFIGVAESDGDDIRVKKVALTVAVVLSVLLSVIWVGTYLTLDLPVSAAIPFGYQVVSVASLAWFWRTKVFRFFRVSQLVMITLLPFLLQWSLGGFIASSAVSVWALVAGFGALFFVSPRQAIPWFVAFVGLTIASGVAEPVLARHPAAIPAPIATSFFVLNVLGLSVTAYALLQYAVRGRDAALASSEALLLNVLPKSIAERLKREAGIIAESHPEVTVLFADVVGFTPFTERTPPDRVVGVLDAIFSTFDGLADRHGIEKIKTIGDAYMAAAGLPDHRDDHAEAAADMALEMLAEVARLAAAEGLDLKIRIGMSSGPVIAGVIGRRKFIYDLWGDTVNTASRMESHGLPGRIQVTKATHERLRGAYRFEDRGEIELKGKGPTRAYLLLGRTEPEAGA
jgi:adenylate cyclase